ncbi:MAG: polysaccharide deacetylase family protein [Victivallales bacterium]|nr:polysaccharide deacetylase family protein [Victivallales bacterium]
MITTEILPLWKDVDASISLTRYVREDTVDRPVMLVVPGGGYACVCRSTEGTPIAERFASLGFQAFILNYRVAPERFPKPQQDIFRAIKLIRANAKEWHVLKDNIAVVGFSAGGHLCISAGLLYDEVDASAGDAADAESARPDAVLSAYPVVTFLGKGHFGSGKNLLGDEYEARKAEFSLETRVNENTPPVFLWHTVEDKVVPLENSLLYIDAMTRHNRPCELHVYQKGAHGQQLGYGNEDIAGWPEQAVKFLKVICGFRFPRKHTGKTIILTFDDACKNHVKTVAPLLLKYGFGATFFITRFNDEWRKEHADTLMDESDLRLLHKWGFEIGNHSWNHPNMAELDAQEVEKEITSINQYLIGAGLPTPVSFAYPGGPYCENLDDALTRFDFRYARTTEKRAWNPEADHKYRIPSIPISGTDTQPFMEAVALAKPGKPVVIVFHGVPDTVHPWVHTPPELFEFYMKYLADNGFDVCAMKDFLA